MARTTLSRFLIRSAAILIVLFAAAVLYNHFLIDRSLEQIRLALDDVSLAREPSQMSAYLFQDILISEIAKPAREAGLDLPEDLMWPDEITQKSSAQFLLEDLLASYQKSRPKILRALDSLSRLAAEQYRQAAQFLEFLLKPQKGGRSVAPRDARLDELGRARELEFQWKFGEAAGIYESFIRNYPSYENLDFVRLNLASVYLRSGNFDAAEKALGEVRLSLISTEHVRLVSLLRKKIAEQRALSGKRAELARTLGLPKERESAQAWFQLGAYDLQLFDLTGAKASFEKALRIGPDSETGKRAQSILNRIHILQNDFRESRRRMRELLEKLPGAGHSI